MLQSRTKVTLSFVAIAGLVIATSVLTNQEVSAQSGTRSQPPTQKETFDQRLWKYLESVCYNQWAPAGDDGGFQESSAPHGALVKTYMNRVAAGNASNLPVGSMIIKENFSPDKKLMAITLMYKSKGYNPEAGDWYWAKFMPDGKIAKMDSPMGKMAISGKAKGCIACHADASDDFAFFND
ncbi:MAG: cytochrome P460 family protein [Fuerstiella sp.]